MNIEPYPGPSGIEVSGPTSNGPASPRSEAAKQVEQLFMNMLVKEMRKSIPGGLFGKTAGSSIYEGLFDRAMAEAMTQGPGTPLRASIEASLPPSASERRPPADALLEQRDVDIRGSVNAVIHDTSIIGMASENDDAPGPVGP